MIDTNTVIWLVGAGGMMFGFIVAAMAERLSWRKTLTLWKDAYEVRRQARALERVNRETFASSDHAMFAMRAHDHFNRLKQERDEARREAEKWEKRWAYQVDKREEAERKLREQPVFGPGTVIDFSSEADRAVSCEECGRTWDAYMRPTGRILCVEHHPSPWELDL